MPTINIIALDGVTIAKSTSITSAQAAQFIALADAIKTARELIRFTEGQQTPTHVSGTPAELHPLTIRQLLPRLDALLSQGTPLPTTQYGTVAHLEHANNPNLDWQTGKLIAPRNETLRSVVSAVGAYTTEAVTLGMLLANENQPFDRVELIGGPSSAPYALRWR